MKIIQFFTLGFLAICTPSGAVAFDDAQITAVENGLSPTNVFKGDKPWSLQERMQHYGVPGVGIAVIQDYKVSWYKTYGLADRETGEPVRATTLFQAGSVSKPVAAFAALQMVEAGQLSLDSDVNSTLVSWKLPDSQFTTNNKVTLRQLLSHTGGLTVHGFGGYAAGDPVPDVVQVLNGTPPANSAAVRVDKAPGGGYRYSGGGYTVAQLMMSDASGKSFPALMDALLIKPLNMSRSTYTQPLPAEWLEHAAAGVLPDGSSVAGKRHTYPEMAAAGLWSTAEDLALFTIEMQKALKGESRLLNREMARTMTSAVDSGYALGWGISDRGESGYFSHGGWDEGFCTQLTAHLEHGYGVVVMINSNHPAFMDELVNAVAHTYSWDGYHVHDALPVPKDWLTKYSGRYRSNAVLALSVTSEDDKLFMTYPGGKPQELVYAGDGRFLRRERRAPVTFSDTENGPVFNFVHGEGEVQSLSMLASDELSPAELLIAGRYEDALAAFRAGLAATPEEDSLSEGYLNRLGFNSLDDSPALAIGIFRINTDLYPDSANTWDSLAYAYQNTGNREKAIEHYRNALKRDPTFASALKGLAELEEAQ